MKTDRSFRILAVLVALAFALALTLAALFVRQVMERNRARIEFHVFRIMAGILDEYSGSRRFDPAEWPGLEGFGIYDASGVPSLRFGTAPERIVEPSGIPFPGISELSSSSMTILRWSGPGPNTAGPTLPDSLARGLRRDGPMIRGASPMGPSMMGSSRRTLPQPRMRMARPPLSGAAAIPPGGVPGCDALSGYIFIEHGVAGMLREGRLALAFVTVFLSAFFAIIVLLVLYSRRLVAYRERERETAQLVQLGEAARTLAHEIKNPLGVIRVQCATLRRTLPEDRARNLGVIEEETARLALMTDRLRDFLSSSRGNPEDRDPASFLEECARRYEGSLAVAPYAGPACVVSIDPTRMMQALDNLISNAIEATSLARDVAPDGGSIPLPELSLSVRRGVASFTVADRAAGVSEEYRARLFEPFFTTKTRGTGIGLALSRRFMEQAGGSLAYEPRPGGGSSFTASLPARRSDA